MRQHLCNSGMQSLTFRKYWPAEDGWIIGQAGHTLLSTIPQSARQQYSMQHQAGVNKAKTALPPLMGCLAEGHVLQGGSCKYRLEAVARAQAPPRLGCQAQRALPASVPPDLAPARPGWRARRAAGWPLERWPQLPVQAPVESAVMLHCHLQLLHVFSTAFWLHAVLS